MLVTQPPGSKQCGQACLATILGLSVDQVAAEMGKTGPTHTRDLARFLAPRGLSLGPDVRVASAGPPDLAILKQNYRLNGREWAHWVVWSEGMVLDPDFGVYRSKWEDLRRRFDWTWFSSFWEVRRG